MSHLVQSLVLRAGCPCNLQHDLLFNALFSSPLSFSYTHKHTLFSVLHFFPPHVFLLPIFASSIYCVDILNLQHCASNNISLFYFRRFSYIISSVDAVKFKVFFKSWDLQYPDFLGNLTRHGSLNLTIPIKKYGLNNKLQHGFNLCVNSQQISNPFFLNWCM